VQNLSSVSCPALTDPEGWLLYRETTCINQRGLPVRLGDLPTLEGIGDKYLAFLAYKLLRKLKIPWVWSHTLQEMFNTNTCYQKFAEKWGIPDLVWAEERGDVHKIVEVFPLSHFPFNKS
jgi:hypothetical protein